MGGRVGERAGAAIRRMAENTNAHKHSCQAKSAPLVGGALANGVIRQAGNGEPPRAR